MDTQKRGNETQLRIYIGKTLSGRMERSFLIYECYDNLLALRQSVEE